MTELKQACSGTDQSDEQPPAFEHDDLFAILNSSLTPPALAPPSTPPTRYGALVDVASLLSWRTPLDRDRSISSSSDSEATSTTTAAAASSSSSPSPPRRQNSSLPSRGSLERILVAIAGTGLTDEMPERPLTVATYAAGASLAAITLVYVFGPTFFFDHDAARSSRASRKKGVVGLVNPANDCFINSVLQALAGLPELRAHLIREVHRRTLDGLAVYGDVSAAATEEDAERVRKGGKKAPAWMTIGLQQGLVTAGLKDMLDALNERPIDKKTISAQAFIRAVERAFNTRISRSQQDAQEFLQIVVERLAEEAAAGRRVRRKRLLQGDGVDRVANDVGKMGLEARRSATQEENHALSSNGSSQDGKRSSRDSGSHTNGISALPDDHANQVNQDEEDEFPMEGKLESQVECSVCHFKPKPSVSSFLTLTLNVPHNEASTTLNACIDGIFKMEHIDDFKCDRCRLEHAMQINDQRLSKTNISREERTNLESHQHKLETALHDDPEKPPKNVPLPALASAPKRRITRHTRISAFPRLLVLHLSRSIWDPHATSSKNMAKVSFPETLPLGGLLDRNTYRLLSVVTHKGGHHSGHYESFRRQVLPAPYSTRASMGTEGIYSLHGSPAPSTSASPQLRSTPVADGDVSSFSSASAIPSIASSEQQASLSLSSSPPHPKRKGHHPTPPPLESIPTPGLPDLPPDAIKASKGGIAGTPQSVSSSSTNPTSTTTTIGREADRISARRRRRQLAAAQNRWWRISDEKVKECKTAEVLSMQREVYLLFYEMVSDADA